MAIFRPVFGQPGRSVARRARRYKKRGNAVSTTEGFPEREEIRHKTLAAELNPDNVIAFEPT